MTMHTDHSANRSGTNAYEQEGKPLQTPSQLSETGFPVVNANDLELDRQGQLQQDPSGHSNSASTGSEASATLVVRDGASDAPMEHAAPWGKQAIEQLKNWADQHRSIRLEHLDSNCVSEGCLVMASPRSVWINNMQTWETTEDGSKRLAHVGPQNGAFSSTGRYDLNTFVRIETTDPEPTPFPGKDLPRSVSQELSGNPHESIDATTRSSGISKADLEPHIRSGEKAEFTHADGEHYSQGVVVMASENSVWLLGRRTYERRDDGRSSLVGFGPTLDVTDVAERLDLKTFSSVSAIDER